MVKRQLAAAKNQTQHAPAKVLPQPSQPGSIKRMSGRKQQKLIMTGVTILVIGILWGVALGK
jgi:hypothetical protein